MTAQKQDVQKLFSTITDYFSPKIIADVNDVYVKLAKIKGQDVPWHTHDDEDELFYVMKGRMRMEMRGGHSFDMTEGELLVVPKGVEHRVHTEEECWLMLIENKTTKHTGDVLSPITKSVEKQRY